MKASSKKVYFGNSSWIMADSLITNFIALVVLAVVARILGPEEYGYYAYVFSLAALFSVLGQMGLDGIFTRELVSKSDEAGSILGTVSLIRFLGYFIGALCFLIYGLFLEGHSTVEKKLFVAAFIYILLMPGIQIVENWFRSKVQAKYSSISKIAGAILGAILKVLAIFGGLGIVWVGVLNTLTMLFILCLSFTFYYLKGGEPVKNWSISLTRLRQLLGESWMIFLGSIFAMIYLKVDQVMLRWLIGVEAVGIYAIVSRMSEMFYFIPAALVATVFPRLITLHQESEEKFNGKLQNFLYVLVSLACLIVIGLWVFSSLFVELIFGEEYMSGIPVLLIHMLAMPFIFMRYAFSRWIIIKKIAIFSLISQGTGAILNVLANIILIPKFGMEGAALATVISYSVASYFVLLSIDKTRFVFFMMSRALCMPWKGLFELKRFVKS